MATPRVFVSYSHADHEAVTQLQTFLKPLERDGLISYWVDTRLQGGDDWQREIDAALDAATVAVLLISQDFLSSDFIYAEELPRMFARAHRSELTVLPVFLRHSDVAGLHFPFRDANGQERRDTLTRFQGFGRPDQPLSDMTESQREREYTRLSCRLRQLAQPRPPDETPASSRSAEEYIVEPTPYSGAVKLAVCGRLVADWPRLADDLEIPASDRARFDRGREPEGVWEWLDARQRLSELADALAHIGRGDLVEVLHRPR